MKEIDNTGMECSAILHIQRHGVDGWKYAYANYCDNCPSIDTCNVVNGKVEITQKGIRVLEELMEGRKQQHDFSC